MYLFNGIIIASWVRAYEISLKEWGLWAVAYPAMLIIATKEPTNNVIDFREAKRKLRG